VSRIVRQHRPIRTVALVSKPGRAEGARLLAEAARWLRERGIRVRFDARTAAVLKERATLAQGKLPAGTDLAIVAGGDGTLLSVARVAAPAGVPILGVNFGGLGFLTELHPDELFPALTRVLRGEHAIEERQALRARIRRAGAKTRVQAVFNDVVVHRAALSRMVTLDVTVDGDAVASYTSDGLIVASPTGSTAYNLSAGGPILDPRMEAFVITPICPHGMTYRPLVVPGGSTVTVSLRSPRADNFLTLDGQIGFPLRPGDTVSVDAHPGRVRLVRVSGRSFFQVLPRKLRWGASKLEGLEAVES
jgi:NAD+ kinase